jgi:MFS family permease
MTSSRQPLSTQARRSTWGAFAGFTIDSFDIYLPLVALAPAIAYFTPATLDPSMVALIASYIFVSTLVARPLGAFIFGSLADRIGRRRATLIAVFGFGITTLAMAALPGYEQWGIGAVVVLIVLRFIGGIMLGGENSGANVLAMEQVPKDRRGLWGAVIQSGGTIAYVLLGAITLVLLAVVPAGPVDSPYVQWGWRIPFVIGGLAALLFAVYYARSVEESAVWEAAGPKPGLSVIGLLQGRELRSFLQVFVMMTGMWVLLNTVTAIVPPILGTALGLTSLQSTLYLMVTWVLVTVLYVAGGVLGQRIGRRTYLIVATLVGLVAGTLSIAYLGGLATGPSFATLLPALVGVAFIAWPWAAVTPYLAERFRTSNRSIGFGLGYTLGVILPSFYASYLGWFGDLVGARYAPIVLLVIGGLLTVVGAALGPETRHTDLSATGNSNEQVTDRVDRTPTAY